VDPYFEKPPRPPRPLISTGAAWAFALVVAFLGVLWFGQSHPKEAMQILEGAACLLVAAIFFVDFD
jgi:hypothetical protein